MKKVGIVACFFLSSVFYLQGMKKEELTYKFYDFTGGKEDLLRRSSEFSTFVCEALGLLSHPTLCSVSRDKESEELAQKVGGTLLSLTSLYPWLYDSEGKEYKTDYLFIVKKSEKIVGSIAYIPGDPVNGNASPISLHTALAKTKPPLKVGYLSAIMYVASLSVGEQTASLNVLLSGLAEKYGIERVLCGAGSKLEGFLKANHFEYYAPAQVANSLLFRDIK